MLKGDKTAVEILNKIDKVFVPIVVVGELFYGAYKSFNPVKIYLCRRFEPKSSIEFLLFIGNFSIISGSAGLLVLFDNV